MSDIPDFLQDATTVHLENPKDVVAKIYQKAAEMARLEQEIEKTKEALQKLVDDKNKLATRELPKLFDMVQTDRFGVPGWEADIELRTLVHANIPVDWEPERRDAGFAELERLGGGDLVRCTVSVVFGRKEYEKAKDFRAYASRWNGLEGRPIEMDSRVQWNSLTKFVEEQTKKSTRMDLEKLGAKLNRVCQIVWRKDKKGL